MALYKVTAPGHPRDGEFLALPEPLAVVGPGAPGIAQYLVPAQLPAPTVEQRLAALRAKRDAMLAASDWTQLADAALTEKARTAWAAYRQALRDVPQQPTAPDVIWPELPTA